MGFLTAEPRQPSSLTSDRDFFRAGSQWDFRGGGFCVPASVRVSGVGPADNGQWEAPSSGGEASDGGSACPRGGEGASLGWVHGDGTRGTLEAVAKTDVMNPSFRETPGKRVKVGTGGFR